jgi:hypothetical protein
MSSFTLRLPSSTITSLNFSSYAQDFRFISEGAVFQCPTIVAEIISPTVIDIRKSDPTFCTFVFNPPVELNHMSTFVSLIEGNSVTVSEDDLPEYLSISKQLGSARFLFSDLPQSFTADTVAEQLLERLSSGLSCDSAIDFAVKNFPDIPLQSLDRLPVSVLSDILENPNLIISSESALCIWIVEHPTDPNFYALLEHVKFEHLKPDALMLVQERFTEIMPCLNSGIIAALGRRMTLPVPPQPGRSERWAPRNGKLVRCDFDYAHKLNGIIQFLSKTCRGKPVEAGSLAVTSSSIARPITEFAPKNILDLSPNSVFSSGFTDDPGPWIMIDFLDKVIVPNAYSFRPGSKADSPRPVNWVVEGSLDGKDWTALDQANNRWVGKPGAIQVQQVTSDKAFRLLRFRMVGLNFIGTKQLTLAGLDFYGEIRFSDPDD